MVVAEVMCVNCSNCKIVIGEAWTFMVVAVLVVVVVVVVVDGSINSFNGDSWW